MLFTIFQKKKNKPEISNDSKISLKILLFLQIFSEILKNLIQISEKVISFSPNF